MIFGALDPHVPEAGRAVIEDALKSRREFSITLYEAEHAFMRDEGAL
jgi:dienelactone hydrolase